MSCITISKKICLESKYLDDNLVEHLREKIKTDYLDHCDQVYGYITEIQDDFKILGNTVSSTSPAVFFQVEFLATTLKPEVGSEYKGKITMILPTCILVGISKMSVVILADTIKGYKYDKATKSFKKGTKELSVGKKVVVELTTIKYEKQSFKCIGILKV